MKANYKAPIRVMLHPDDVELLDALGYVTRCISVSSTLSGKRWCLVYCPKGESK